MRQMSIMAPAKSSCDPMTQNPNRPTATLLFAGLMVTVMCAALHAEPQVAQVQDDAIVEVTAQDFVTLPKIVSTQLSTFGIRFGMNGAEVAAALGKHCPKCSLKRGQSGEDLIIFEGDELPAAAVKYSEDLVERIRWMSNMRNHLMGQSKELLTPEAYTPDSPVRLELLGREDTYTPVTESNSVGATSTQTFVYAKEGLQLELFKTNIMGNAYSVMSVKLTKPARIR